MGVYDKFSFKISNKVFKQVSQAWNTLEKGYTLSEDQKILIGLKSGFHTTCFDTMKDDGFKAVNGSMLNQSSLKKACISFVSDLFLNNFSKEVRLYKDNVLILTFKPKVFRQSLKGYDNPNEQFISSVLQRTQSYLYDPLNKDSIQVLKLVKYYLYLMFNSQEK